MSRASLLLVTVSALGLPRGAAATCGDEGLSLAGMTRRLDRAEAAFRVDDPRAQEETAEEVIEGLPCLEDVLPPEQSLRLHRVLGLYKLLVRKDEHVARNVFAGARGVNDRFPPDDLFPPGSSRLDAYTAADMSSPRYQQLPGRDGQTLYINGTRTDRRPRDWPVVAQIREGGDGLCRSTYLWPEEELELCGTRGAGRVGPKPVSSRRRSGGLLTPATVIGGVGVLTLTTGLTLYTGSWIRYHQIKDDAAYTQAYYEGTLRPWAATGLAISGVGLAATGGAVAWMAVDEGQRPVIAVQGRW